MLSVIISIAYCLSRRRQLVYPSHRIASHRIPAVAVAVAVAVAEASWAASVYSSSYYSTLSINHQTSIQITSESSRVMMSCQHPFTVWCLRKADCKGAFSLRWTYSSIHYLEKSSSDEVMGSFRVEQAYFMILSLIVDRVWYEHSCNLTLKYFSQLFSAWIESIWRNSTNRNRSLRLVRIWLGTKGHCLETLRQMCSISRCWCSKKSTTRVHRLWFTMGQIQSKSSSLMLLLSFIW